MFLKLSVNLLWTRLRSSLVGSVFDCIVATVKQIFASAILKPMQLDMIPKT